MRDRVHGTSTRYLHTLLALACLYVALSNSNTNANSVPHHTHATDDLHGGVPMGIRSNFCDNGRLNTSIDWDPRDNEVYKCGGPRRSADVEFMSSFHCDDEAKRPIHVCYPQPIDYVEGLPTSGPHRPLWPKYGEYRYLPVQRWLHSLEHGSIVFLYHPCANKQQILHFKRLAKGCLRRHIISPSKRLPDGMSFAVLSWKCKLVLTRPDEQAIVQFVRMDLLTNSIHLMNQESTRRREEYKVKKNRLLLLYGRLIGYN